MKTDLLPCPFCGNAAIAICADEYGSGGQHVPPYHAVCDVTQKGCGVTQTGEDPKEAAAAWNRRTASGALAGDQKPDEKTPESAPAALPIVQPDFSWDDDDDLAIDWSLSYALTWDGHKQHGTADMPALPIVQQEPARDAAYDKIDRFMRNNLDDSDYAEFSEALETLYASPQPSQSAQPQDERAAAEASYTVIAFDYVNAPVGSRDWSWFWSGWQARAAMSASPAAVPENVRAALDRMSTPLHESWGSVARGATAAADAGDMKLLRDYIEGNSAAASADAQDAARYRWLRSDDIEVPQGQREILVQMIPLPFREDQTIETLFESALDEAIDAAMSAPSAGGQSNG